MHTPSPGLILALESGGEHLSVALLDATRGLLLAEHTSYRAKKTEDSLLTLAATLLRHHDLRPQDLGLIAVGRGPGSFTGVRIALSLTTGLSLAASRPVWPVSSLAALALQAGPPGTLAAPLFDARRGEVYGALYRLQAAAPPEVLLPPACVAPEALAEKIRALLSATADVPIFLGSGALAYQLATDLPIPHHTLSAASIASLALLEWEIAHGDITLAPPLDPMYLRRSEAEIQADLRDHAEAH